MDKQELKIGELARAAAVGVETVRYYERRGLLEKPPRSEGGYRIYPPATVKRIRFIKRAQELGFTLKEISELLALRTDDEASCEQVRAVAKAKLEDVKSRLRDLRRIKRILYDLTNACPGTGSASHCIILESLNEKEMRKWHLEKLNCS